jgi:hypothetical protein
VVEVLQILVPIFALLQMVIVKLAQDFQDVHTVPMRTLVLMQPQLLVHSPELVLNVSLLLIVMLVFQVLIVFGVKILLAANLSTQIA